MLKEVFEKYGRRVAVITSEERFSAIDFYEIKFKSREGVIVDKRSISSENAGILSRKIPVIKSPETVYFEDIQFIFEYGMAISLRDENNLSYKLADLAHQIYLADIEENINNKINKVLPKIMKLYFEIIKIFFKTF